MKTLALIGALLGLGTCWLGFFVGRWYQHRSAPVRWKSLLFPDSRVWVDGEPTDMLRNIEFKLGNYFHEVDAEKPDTERANVGEHATSTPNLAPVGNRPLGTLHEG